VEKSRQDSARSPQNLPPVEKYRGLGFSHRGVQTAQRKSDLGKIEGKKQNRIILDTGDWGQFGGTRNLTEQLRARG